MLITRDIMVKFMIFYGTFVFGMLFTKLGSTLNFKVGFEGVKYYDETHPSKIIALSNTILLPLRIYGLLILITNLFVIKSYTQKVVIWCFYFFYVAHYLTINFKVGVLFGFVAFYPLMFAIIETKNGFRLKKLRDGLYWVSLCWGINFILGYILGIEYLLDGITGNEILYSMYYSISHLL